MKKTISALICLFMATIYLAGCGNNQQDISETHQTAQTEQETSGIEEPMTTETESETESENDSAILNGSDVPDGIFEVETPYCMLTYPMTWQYNLAIEQENIENGHIVSFYAVIEGRENLRVFDVIFGGNDDIQGDLVGQLETGSGEIPVSFKTYSIYENENLSYDESEMLLAMIEDINVIYSGLSALKNFN